MNIKFFLIGILCLIGGAIIMSRYKFYKHKTSDSLFGTKLGVFLSAAILALFGILILISEFKNLLH